MGRLIQTRIAIVDNVPIRAIYNGVQQAAEPFELWTILEPLGEHPQYSTLSRRTIETQGRTIVRVEKGGEDE